jgi:hypothetical protein
MRETSSAPGSGPGPGPPKSGETTTQRILLARSSLVLRDPAEIHAHGHDFERGVSPSEAASLTGRSGIMDHESGGGTRFSCDPAREVRRTTTIVLTFALSLLMVAPPHVRPAFAHGFGQSYDLSLPL